MRIGIHSCSFNASDESPILPLFHAITKRGHDVVFLDTDKATQEGDHVIFPNLPAGAHLDAFVSYLPFGDLNKLWNGDQPNEVPYFKQVEWLSSKFQSANSYQTQMITNSKVAMERVFTDAGVPIPRTRDGNDPALKDEILEDIRNGKKLVLKPDAGGSGCGIIRLNFPEDSSRSLDEDGSTPEKARKLFESYVEPNGSFPVQDYIEKARTPDGGYFDYRAIVVGDRVVGGIQRITRPDEWRGNNALGSTNHAYQFTPQQERDAVKAMQGAQLKFGSVEIIIDAQGQHYICEINDGLSMDSLTKARPDLDLPDLVVQMFEQEHGEQKQNLCKHDFAASALSSSSTNVPFSAAVQRNNHTPIIRLNGMEI